MTHTFSAQSLHRARFVDPELMGVAIPALARCAVDFGITEEQSRTAAEQQEKFAAGVSKVPPGPKARHMIQKDGTSKALDLVPWIDGRFQWGDKDWKVATADGRVLLPFHEIAVAMRHEAIAQSVSIRWGAVWDRKLHELPDTVDGLVNAIEAYKVRHAGADFLDGPHFELIT